MFARGFFGGLILSGLLLTPALGETFLPERRSLLVDGFDLPGGDLRSLFDTTLENCERACLSDSACLAFTYNARNGSCFPKSSVGTPAPYARAISGSLVATSAEDEARAKTRAEEVGFLPRWMLSQATTLARGLGRDHLTSAFSAEELREAAEQAAASGDAARAAELWGAAANASGQAGDWESYAVAILSGASRQGDSELKSRALLAAVNAYLRAGSAPEQHTMLLTLSRALEATGQGRLGLRALRLAQELQQRDDTAVEVERLASLYGFRIEEHRVDSDLASPRICARFTDELASAGVDYTPFVQLNEPGLTVETGEWAELCVAGFKHGQRASITFREGLPAADGQVLAKSVNITAYIRDRKPQVSFASGGFVLPKSGTPALPVNTVNATRLDLELYRVSDRSALRSIQSEWFGRPMDDWDGERFTRDIGEKIWSGTAEVPTETNRDMSTRLPLAEALSGQGAGLYALKARIPGRAEDYENLPAWQWFVVSDLGVTSFWGVDGLTVVARSLADAGPKAGVEVQLLARSNRVMGRAITDAEGIARFDAATVKGTGAGRPALITLTEGEDDFAMLSLAEPEFDLSDRGVEGREASPPIDVFLATDRGAYRAGETVHATALARDGEARALPGLPLTALLRRPDGVEHWRQRITDQEGGFAIAAPIAGNAPRGAWKLEIYADPEAPALAVQSFLVEDFLPERIDFTLSLPEGPVESGTGAEVGIEARYLFGAPGAELTAEGEVVLRQTAELAGHPGYRFGLVDQPFSPMMISLDAGAVTDTEGRATITAELPEVKSGGRPLEAEYRIRVAEGSGRPVERRITRPLAPEAALIGVKPGFEDAVRDGEEARFQTIAVGAEGLAAKWKIERIETRYQWYQMYGEWNWEPLTRRTKVAEGQIALGATPQEIAAKVDWGQYELTVAAADGRVATSLRFTAGWYAPADTTRSPDMLELSLDKPDYAPGDTARLRIVPRAAGTALVSVLSNRVITMKTIAVTEGENVLDLPVTDEWGAGVYVTASVLRPMDAEAARLPSRALGLAHAAIAPGDRKLSAQVEVAAEATPRSDMEIAVKVEGVKPGEKAFATIAAVDVGILNLTGYKSPDPAAHYFGQRKLGVGIRDLYGRLIDGLNGAEGIVRSGGDAGRPGLAAPPPTEELVAWFEGPIEVDAEGYARTTVPLPSFNGTVRVMAVVWSDSGIGQAEAEVLVRDPVVVTASLPRFLQPGDESRLLLEIVHATGPAGRMSLDVTATGATLGQVPEGVDLAQGGKASVSIPVSASAEGLAGATVTLTTPDGKTLTKPLNLPVMNTDPEIQRVTKLELPAGKSITLGPEIFAEFAQGTGHALLSAGGLARFDAPGLLAALDAYPYGCSEQLTSRALPLIYFDQLAQALDLPGAPLARERIAQTIEALLLNQTSEGGFGLWSASSGSNIWLDAYVSDFLSRARSQGHAVPDRAFRAALDNLRAQVNYAGDFEKGGEALAYALMVLAREGAAAIGDLRYYADVKAGSFATPLSLAQLASGLASYGDQPRADALFRRAAELALQNDSAREEQYWRVDFGSRLRDTAGVLALALQAGSTAIEREAFASRLAASAGTRALSTQEQAWILLAANGMVGGQTGEGLSLNGAQVEGPLVRRITPAEGPMTIENGSRTATALTLAVFGKPEGRVEAESNGYQISRRYFTMDGVVAEAGAVKSGTRLVVVLEVTPTGKGEGRLLVEDPLPAGFEIDNPNLMRGGQIAALDWLSPVDEVEHSEFRQDRFMSALDWRSTESFQLAYIVRAVSPGRFHHPAASVSDMYRPTFRGQTASGSVTISE